MPLIKLNIRLVLRRLKKISSIKLSAIAASLEKEVEIVVGLCVKSVCGTPHPSRKLGTFSSRRRRKPFMPYYIRNRIIANNFTLLLDFRKNQLTNRLLSAKIMGLKNSGPIWLRFPIQFNTESCPSGRRCSTRNFLKSWLFAPLKKPVKSGAFFGSKIEYFVVLSVSSFQKFSEEMRNYIHGELSEWSKVQHSKCCVPKRNLGFESLTLRQKVQ